MNHALDHLSLEKIDKVTAAVVDTSSIIFARKAGFLLPLTRAVKLTAPPGVLTELQGDLTPELGLGNVDTMPEAAHVYDGYAVDAQVVVTALRRRMPVVSDDFKLLQRAADQGIDGFTVRTMLELTLLRGKIDLTDYTRCKRALSGLIRYALPLFVAAEELHWEIRKQIG